MCVPSPTSISLVPSCGSRRLSLYQFYTKDFDYMADSFGKKDREKQKRKRKEEKAARKERRKAEGIKGNDIMYVDEFGNFTTTPPDLTKKKVV